MHTFGLISHLSGNIGHLMMAVGIEEILADSFSSNIALEHFGQHTPFVIYPKHHPLRIINRSPCGRLNKLKTLLNTETAVTLLKTQLRDLSDISLVIGCGGPNIVPGVSASPEMGLMYHHLLSGFASQGIPVVDFGVGSCYPLENIPDKIEDENDISFFKRYFKYCKASTVRDSLAKKLWGAIGRDARLIPCAAIATGKRFEKFKENHDISDSEKYIAINFQEKGANDDWSQNVDINKWKDTVRKLIAKLKKRHNILFLCHDRKEYELAKEIDLSVESFYPKNFIEYAGIVWKIKTALVCRIHAAIPLAGIGVPSLVVGTDSRLGAVELIGLKTFYVKEVSHQLLEDQLESLLKNRKEERDRLISVREDTIRRYGEIIQHFLV